MKMIKRLFSFIKKHPEVFIVVISTIISVAALIFYYSKGLTLAYDDAESHLNIARRVIDCLTPGFVQIGSTWLPLLHILEIPLIWNDFLWHSGLAGSIISVCAYVLSCLFIFKIVDMLTKDKLSALISTSILWANANMLYMQTTPMFEPLLIVTMLGAIYYLFKWTKTDRVLDLLLSAFFIMLGSMARYDGWALLISAIFYVFIYSYRHKNYKHAEGITLFYASLACLGVLLWLVYNLTIFGNPLYFAKNEFSAFSQQLVLASHNTLFTKGNIFLSAKVYLAATFLNQGALFSLIALIGLLIYVIKNKLDVKSWVLYLLLIPIPFNILALLDGHSVIWLPDFPPYFQTFFNIRYGILMLPAVAVFIGYFTMKNQWKKILIILVIFAQILLFYSLLPNRQYHLSFVTLRDTVASINQPTLEATDWLKKNYGGGLILISSASSDAFIFQSGLDLKQFITEGTGHYWFESLKDPTSHAEWIILFPAFGDRVGKALRNSEVLVKDYKIVYQNKNYFIFKRLNHPASSTNNNVNSNTLWSVESIDTMKTSRDEARYFFTNSNYKERVQKELQIIKNLGANYVSIDTPYDKEFLPVLTYWVESAHKLGLHVWFRGNFSSWEGWFNYPKNLTTEELLKDTQSFIADNSNLFNDGDSFTPAPEAENGGPWKPIKDTQFDSYRSFIRNEYDICKSSFQEINKQVICNWLSMNGDVANNVLDQQTVNYIGNLVTIDHYVKNKNVMNSYLENIHNKFHANIFVGEFGAPLLGINTKMNDDQQSQFVTDIIDLLSQKDYVIGLNYWVLSDSSTSLTDSGLQLKSVALVVQNYFKPGILKGRVVNSKNLPINKAEVYYNNIRTLTDSNGQYTLYLPSGIRTIFIQYGGLKELPSISISAGEIINYTTMLTENNQSKFEIVNPEEYNILNWIMGFNPQNNK